MREKVNFKSYTVSVFAENTPGVLHRITTLFTRRKVNIDSLTVSETERHGISRFTVVFDMDESTVKTVVKQIARVIEVMDVFVTTAEDLVYCEVALIKVRTESAQGRSEVENLAHRYGATVTHATEDYLFLRKAGYESEIDSLRLLLESHGLEEFIRSGRIALLKETARPAA